MTPTQRKHFIWVRDNVHSESNCATTAPNVQYIDQNVRHNGQNNANLSEMEVITTNLFNKKKPISIK